MFSELINLSWLTAFSCGSRFPQYRAGEGGRILQVVANRAQCFVQLLSCLIHNVS